MEKHDDSAQWTDERMARLAPDTGWDPDVIAGLVRLRAGREAIRARHHRRMWIAVGVTVATVFLMTTPLARAFAHRCGEFLARSVAGTGSTRAYAKADQRQAMPDFTLADASGQPVRLSDFRGKVVLLNFWTTSCRQCDGEIPWFMEFQKTYGDSLVVLGLSLDKAGWESVRPYAEEKQINYRVMVGGDEVTRQYGRLRSIPTTLLIDKWGRIAVTHVGYCAKSEYETDTKALLAEN